jgi:hypothetical protein
MTIARVIFSIVGLIALPALASAQETKIQSRSGEGSKTETEIRKFFDSYGEDLRKHDREAIAGRYDRSGVYLMGNGRKSLMSYEAIRNRYLKDWNGPKNFVWKDVSVDVTSKTSAVVTAQFEWTADSPEPAKCSYTGLFLKRAGEWRIRLEDESCEPRRPAETK